MIKVNHLNCKSMQVASCLQEVNVYININFSSRSNLDPPADCLGAGEIILIIIQKMILIYHL